MYKKVLFCVFYISLFYDVVNSCSCLPMTVPEKYCRADFVMKVRVLSNLKNPSGEQGFDAFYRIKIKGVPWKFNFENDVSDMKRVYTASNSALCGVYLQKRKRYLISGRVDKEAGIMRMNSCLSIAERTRLVRSTKRLKNNPPNCAILTAPDKFLPGPS
ncbi:metalloproteinase inhibitor 2-like [Mercenaria mercenaria]|uniref:metalloproteinase inhibitor 2-like n=1 Tax=Mercenaria mercenaria TaxID=6596 RepID=UPI00234E42A1|nr:metalloproteinase inhibitor 2-like [Mercenaria mercenaria]